MREYSLTTYEVMPYKKYGVYHSKVKAFDAAKALGKECIVGYGLPYHDADTDFRYFNLQMEWYFDADGNVINSRNLEIEEIIDDRDYMQYNCMKRFNFNYHDPAITNHNRTRWGKYWMMRANNV